MAARRRSGRTKSDQPKEPPMTADTEAQAAMLTTVASHLTNHPHLCPVNILSEDRLQLRIDSCRDPGYELATWADTLTDPRVDVQRIHCEYDDTLKAFVYVVGHLGELAVSVWDVVPGLVDALTPEAFDATTGHIEITVDGLRAFAEDGTAPNPVGELAPA